MSIEFDAALATLSAGAHGKVGRNVPLAPFTSYQLGGPAAVFLEAESLDDLLALTDLLREQPLPMLIVGRGSNMLISDRGFSGVAVRLGAAFRWARREADTMIRAGAGMPLPGLATVAADAGLSGVEFAMAIPASVGGAVAMNAGAHHRSVSDVLSTATVFEVGSGRVLAIPAADLQFGYRSSQLPAGSIVTEAVFELAPADATAIAEAMREARDWRRATQPIGLPNAGSVFKNPPEAPAAALVERVVGKGTGQGGARVSEVHANFIVTDEGATANDVYTLIRRIQRAVLDNEGVTLETEVKLIGEFQETS